MLIIIRDLNSNRSTGRDRHSGLTESCVLNHYVMGHPFIFGDTMMLFMVSILNSLVVLMYTRSLTI